ncbi:MAG TPA: metal/formaldehyde-sensitive transcriptional repressor [Thermoanaerobaculia bacterium]|nr:metal/formaldehyde-sensitive transcriptional repressor [Thermoanaerobaculia bacterium]
MTHLVRDRKKLLNRISRIRGQLDAIQRGLLEEHDCSEIMHTVAACRGAISGLMAEVLESHIREDVSNPDHQPTSARARATQELIDIVKTYVV